MADLPELDEWTPGVYQIETSDPVLGGPEGISNQQAKQLASRTRWLKGKIEALIDGAVSAAKAVKLATARTISISGAGTGNASFDGSANAIIALTLADSGAVAGSFTKVAVNAKGLVTGGATLAAGDIPALDWSKITTGKPTTLGSYGIVLPTQVQAEAGTDNALPMTSLRVLQAIAVNLGNLRGILGFVASGALDSVSFGRLVNVSPSSVIPTLPPVGGASNNGKAITFSAANGCTIKASGAELIYDRFGVSANTLTLAPGDQVQLVTDGVSWRVGIYSQAPFLHGKCRLAVVSTTSLKLSPYNGNGLVINGVQQQIPAAGVSVSNAGLSAATGYYVYAYMNAGVMTLECSSTGHSLHTNSVEIKNGDATRTLVGWTQTGTSSVFAPDSGTTISTMNWFNRRQKTVVASTVADLIFTNTTMSELSASLRAIAPAWAGDSCISNINGNFLNAVSGSGVNAQLYSGGYAQGTRMSSNLSGDVYCPFNTQASLLAMSDGLLNCQLFGFVGSGSGRVVAGAQLLLSSWV